jgi:hypothetical protein
MLRKKNVNAKCLKRRPEPLVRLIPTLSDAKIPLANVPASSPSQSPTIVVGGVVIPIPILLPVAVMGEGESSKLEVPVNSRTVPEVPFPAVRAAAPFAVRTNVPYLTIAYLPIVLSGIPRAGASRASANSNLPAECSQSFVSAGQRSPSKEAKTSEAEAVV